MNGNKLKKKETERKKEKKVNFFRWGHIFSVGGQNTTEFTRQSNKRKDATVIMNEKKPINVKFSYHGCMVFMHHANE